MPCFRDIMLALETCFSYRFGICMLAETIPIIAGLELWARSHTWCTDWITIAKGETQSRVVPLAVEHLDSRKPGTLHDNLFVVYASA